MDVGFEKSKGRREPRMDVDTRKEKLNSRRDAKQNTQRMNGTENSLRSLRLGEKLEGQGDHMGFYKSFVFFVSS